VGGKTEPYSGDLEKKSSGKIVVKILLKVI
jgi:hypothetical protein